MKKIFILFFFGIIFFNLAGGAGTLESFSGNFFEGFESNSFTTNNWTLSAAGNNWIINGNFYQGSYAAECEPANGGDSIIEIDVDTTNYENISFSFYTYTYKLDIGEYIAADWYNGTTWINLMQIEDIGSYALYSYNLTNDANNNSAFKIRFRCLASNPREMCYVDNVNVVGDYAVEDNINPNVVFNFQDPADINTFNIFPIKLNISYNVSDETALNLSSVKLFYKTNSSSQDSYVSVNGTLLDSSNFLTSLIDKSNQADIWYFKLKDNSVYPATYNFNEVVMENTTHSIYDLNSARKLVKIELLNVSNQKNYSIFEVMVNNSYSFGARSLRVYYCNSSYVSGDVLGNSDCTNFYNLPAQSDYNHSHSEYASHQTIPFAINTTSGKIGNVYVTNTSYFILRGRVGIHAWDIYYVDNVSRISAIQTSTTRGNSWSDFSGTVDAHLHQYDGSEKFYYYVCANDTSDNQNCSNLRSDLLNLTGLPPTSPNVYAPNESIYSGNIIINYTASLSPNGYAISYYNISLVDLNETFFQLIQTNNSLNLSYVWNSSLVSDGEYFIRVEACDVVGQCSSGFSENITIQNVVDTCMYSGSGNWVVNCSDDCMIDSNVDLEGNNISITGYGSFSTTANITNFTELYIQGINSVNRCEVYCSGGGCFKS
ncbi:hypothetical protein HOD88_03740 [archaeon]|jgi:hypothetical protein|nr:hypothetical protein [archaeon]